MGALPARLLVIAVVALAGAAPLASAHAAASHPETWVSYANGYPETWVSYSKLYPQVRSGPLIRAIINPARGDIEIKFTNLDEWHAFYPPGARQTLQRILAARHVHTIFVPRPHVPRRTTVHHHLRYIAAGVLGGLAVLAAALVLYRRRRTGGRTRASVSAG
jgi:hypothetical protein